MTKQQARRIFYAASRITTSTDSLTRMACAARFEAYWSSFKTYRRLKPSPRARAAWRSR